MAAGITGCANADKLAEEAAGLYARVPAAAALTPDDCAAGLESARAGYESSKAEAAELRERLSGVLADAAFRERFAADTAAVNAGAREFIAACGDAGAEVRQLSERLADRMGVAELVGAW